MLVSSGRHLRGTMSRKPRARPLNLTVRIRVLEQFFATEIAADIVQSVLQFFCTQEKFAVCMSRFLIMTASNRSFHSLCMISVRFAIVRFRFVQKPKRRSYTRTSQTASSIQWFSPRTRTARFWTDHVSLLRCVSVRMFFTVDMTRGGLPSVVGVY